ncbi:MAG: hypothetical protein M3R50_11745 [Bacteroidota bacterium]|nr:hypothetical protein [Bacteroidota bacterium]
MNLRYKTALLTIAIPAVAGFVIKPEDWKYSSARDFCGGKGLVALSYS